MGQKSMISVQNDSKEINRLIEDEKRDIELKKAYFQLHEQQIFQTAILQNVPSMIYVKNAKKEMIYSFINKAGEDILGLSAAQIIGKKDQDLYPVEVSNILTQQENEIFESRKVFKNEKEQVEINGEIKYFMTFKVPTFDEIGKPHLLIVISRDITEEVIAKRELEVERSKKISDAKLASLADVAAGVAHEINNPLAIISSALVLLRKYRNYPEKFEEKIKSILNSISRITQIINGLKKFSRTAHYQKSVYNRRLFSQIVSEALLLIDIKAKQHSILIESNLENNCTIYCDESEIEQVVIHLIKNSIYAIKNLTEKWIKINLFEIGEEVILQVIDSGQGLSVDIEAKLFEPFFTTKPNGDGVGLGLSIAKGILDSHQAEIRLNRQIVNTCFEIKFKKAQPEVKVA